MADIRPRRSALSGAYRTGDFGTVSGSGPGVVLKERRGRALVQLATDLGHYEAAAARIEDKLGLALPRTPSRAIAAGELAALWLAPGRALLVGPDTRDLEREAASALGNDDDVAVTDLSHARTIIRASGRGLRGLLAKGCGLDFHPRAFAAGACVQSAYHHIGVLIHALDDTPTVEIYASRGFALSLWEHLVEGALEFGCRIEPELA